MTSDRIGRRDLERIGTEVAEGDWELLERLRAHRYLTSPQIADFLFSDRPSDVAAIRAAGGQATSPSSLIGLMGSSTICVSSICSSRYGRVRGCSIFCSQRNLA